MQPITGHGTNKASQLPWSGVLATAAIAAVAAAAFAGSIAHLSCGPDGITLTSSPAPELKLSLVQAIAAAERHAGGKALGAAVQPRLSGWVYVVDIDRSGEVLQFSVDGNNGHVVPLTPPRPSTDAESD